MTRPLPDELARFDAECAIEQARTPPASWYLDPAFLQLEAETVFRQHWLCVGCADSVADPGSYSSASVLDRQYLLARDSDGQLRGFHNVCRHHAAVLKQGDGRCETIECPYHGWTYGLDGRLLRAPRAGGIGGFRRDDYGLAPLQVGVEGPLLFALDADELPSRPPLVPAVVERLKWHGLRFAARREYRLRCNWKVFVDNYLDGGYHVDVLHRGLADQLALGSYRTELVDNGVVQSCAADGEATDGADFAARLGDSALYYWIYPNLMLNRYGPILDVNRVLPLSASETMVVYDYFFEPAVATDQAFVDRALTASDRVQAEDTEICESVQRGLASGAFDRGPYAPKLEVGALAFHRRLATDLASGACFRTADDR